MSQQLVVLSPIRSAVPSGHDGFHGWLKVDGVARTIELQIAGIELIKAGIIDEDVSDRLWSALLLELKERVLLQLSFDDGDEEPSWLTVISSELSRARQVADAPGDIPDLMIEGVRF